MKSIGSRFSISFIALSIALCAARPAPAQRYYPPPPPTMQEPAIPLRVWGLGTAIGGGWGDVTGIDQCKSIPSNQPPCWATLISPHPRFLYPTLEVRVFTRNGDSVNLSIPVFNMLIAGFADGISSFGTDVFYNFNFGRGVARFFVGPGIGFNMTAGVPLNSNARYSTGTVRLGGLAGVEFVTPGHHFGFQIRVRPWMQGSFGSIGGEPATGFGGGVFGELVFMGYGTRMSR